jgi:hypothetical protein
MIYPDFAASLLPRALWDCNAFGSALTGIKENLVSHKKLLTKIEEW